MSKQILVLPGDGIGPEIMAEAVKVLELANDRFQLGFELAEDVIGGAAIDKHGVPLADQTLQRARQADAVLLGAVGGGAEVGQDRTRYPSRARPAEDPLATGPVRQPASGHPLSATGRGLQPEA